MKDRVLIYIALIFSVASSGYAGWLHHRTETIVKKAVAQRETEIVKYLAPRLRGFFVGFGIQEGSIPKSPTTIEELFQPVEKMSQIATRP